MPFSKGDPNINRKGRIDGGGGLKAYDRAKFNAMSDEQKEEFLKTIAPELRYRMAEGNPDNKTEATGELKVLLIDKELAGLYGIRTAQETDGSSQEPNEVQGT